MSFAKLFRVTSLGNLPKFTFRQGLKHSLSVTNFDLFSVAMFRHFCKVPSNDLPNCNIGTIGHVDHGKTTLTAAITKVLAEQGTANFTDYDQIDRAPQEKARGITINASHVGYSSTKRRYAHTDCPGHRDFVKNMICGASQMDGAILVVAATDGPMPQTREHISLAKALGVQNIVLYINKADLCDPELIELVDLEVRELLDEFGYDSENVPVVVGSALCALKGNNDEIGKDSILKLIDAIDSYIQVPDRNLSGPFNLPIESAFTAPGRGTVAIGTIVRGEVKKGDKIEILGFGRKLSTNVADVQRFKSSVDFATAGENVGLLVRGIKRELLERGMVMCNENTLKQTDHFEAHIYVRTKEEGGRSKPISNNYQQQLFMDLFNMPCLVELPENQTMIMPGDTVTTKILLRKPMVIQDGQEFIIRENDLYVMSGKVSKLLPISNVKIPHFNVPPPQRIKVEGKKKKRK